MGIMDGRANPLTDQKVVGASGYVSVYLFIYLPSCHELLRDLCWKITVTFFGGKLRFYEVLEDPCWKITVFACWKITVFRCWKMTGFRRGKITGVPK